VSVERLREMVSAATPGPMQPAPTDGRWWLVWAGDRSAFCQFVRDEADARLIALAPEMAELLADMGEWLETYYSPVAGPRPELLARLDALVPAKEDV
jgi:hypothetical protein